MSSAAEPCSVDTNIQLDASLSTLRGDSSSSLSILGIDSKPFDNCHILQVGEWGLQRFCDDLGGGRYQRRTRLAGEKGEKPPKR